MVVISGDCSGEIMEWLKYVGFRANYSSLTNDLHQVTNRSELEILQKTLIKVKISRLLVTDSVVLAI